jgi:Tfp pilus assembly protein PilE
MTAALFAVLALAAVPHLKQQKQRERLTDGVSLLSLYAVEMERYFLDHGRYDSAGSDSKCGVSPPANTQFLSFSCKTDGETYVATVRGVGALEGYEYVLDDSSRKTVRFAGAPVHANCWLRTESSCYG